MKKSCNLYLHPASQVVTKEVRCHRVKHVHLVIIKMMNMVVMVIVRVVVVILVMIIMHHRHNGGGDSTFLVKGFTWYGLKVTAFS